MEVLIEDGNGGTLTSSCPVTVLSGVDLHDPDAPTGTVQGVDYQFHQTSGISNCDGLTASTLISEHSDVVKMTQVPGEDRDSDNQDFGLVYTGYINAPADGEYRFYIYSDDGNRLTMHGIAVAKDEGPHSPRWSDEKGTMTPIGLKAGKHAFELRFYENRGGQVLKVEWESPGLSRTEIVATDLYRVAGGNITPVAEDDSVSTDQDTPVGITLGANDADGDDLAWNVGTPSNGTLSGTAPNLTYTPDAGSSGPDSFTFTVNDGAVDSNTATVSITVNPTNKNLTISNMLVSTGKTYVVDDSLVSGEDLYIDRSYTYNDVGSYAGMIYIRTANNDKSESVLDYLTFDVNKDVTVYVTYDIRASSVPDWMSTWTATGDTITVNGDVSHVVFSKTFTAGTIVLGGNKAPGWAGANTNYTVLIDD